VLLSCRGSSEYGSEVPAWRLTARYVATKTDISFDNDLEADMWRYTATVGFEHRFGDRWTVQLGGGAALSGTLSPLEDPTHPYEFDPGWFVYGSGSFRALDDERYQPFLLVGLTAAATGVGTDDGLEQATLTAIDIRASLTVGKFFLDDTFAPYFVGRVFAGPILWQVQGQSLTGTDDNHVQVGAGFMVTSAGRLAAYTEIIPLGERSVSVGASVTF
jgi:hypothetical protein